MWTHVCLTQKDALLMITYTASVLGFSHELVTWKLRIHSPLPQGEATSLHINIYNSINMYTIHV